MSVIMPCYNAERFLSEAVESVLAQTWEDFELILIDDGSQDSTPRLLETYAARDRRVVTVRQENRGAPAARNRGIALARGPWLAILDADDVALPRRLEIQMDRLARRPDLVALASGSTAIEADGRKLKTYRYPTGHRRFCRRLRRNLASPAHSSFVYRTDAVRQVGGFRPRLVPAEDIDLCLRLSELGRLACLPQSLVCIRRHDRNISSAQSGTLAPTKALAACVCHWCRRWGGVDPAEVLSDSQWESFVTWVRQALETEGAFRQQTAWNALKQEFQRSGAISAKLGCVVRRVLQEPNLQRFLVTKYWGRGYAMTLARQWIRQSQSSGRTGTVH